MVRHGCKGLGIDPPLRAIGRNGTPSGGRKVLKMGVETAPNGRRTGPKGGYPGSRVVVVIVITLTLTILLFT